jgi:DNA-binding transcriptional regulator YhcF (GntR family)
MNATQVYDPQTAAIIFSQIEQELETLKAENSELREQLNQAEEERDQLREEKIELIRRYETRLTQQFQYDTHRDRIMRSPNMSLPQKSVALAVEQELLKTREDAREAQVISMEGLAAKLAVSPDTVSRNIKKLQTLGVANYERGKTEIKTDGSYYTPVSVNLTDLFYESEKIVMPEDMKHGGKRVKTCKACGSDDIDSYTVDYCRSCGKVHWYGQPGIRSDADVVNPIQAVIAGQSEHESRLEEWSNQEPQKHDAFGNDPQPDPEPTDQEQDIPQPHHDDQDSQKHHAFGVQPQLASQTNTYNMPRKLQPTYTCIRGHEMITIKHKGWEAVECPICDHTNDTGDRETFEI